MALIPDQVNDLEMKTTRYPFDGFVHNSLMKKFFISVLTVAVMLNLCSCSKEFIDKPDSRKAIAFSNIETRGVVTSADAILSMGVFAQMNLGDEDKDEAGSNNFIMLLENEHVSRTSTSAPWTYGNTRYWVADRVFYFFAVWPYSEDEDNTSVTNVSSEGTGTGAYGYSVTFETPEAANQELMTAKARYMTKTGEPFSESVDFDFKHELTNVNLKIWSNGAPENVQDKIRVKEVTLSNVTKKGTLRTTAATESESNWTYSSDKISFTTEYEEEGEDGEYGITVSQAQIIDGKLVPNEVSQYNPSKDNPGIPFGDNGLLLIPQTITNSDPILVTVVYYLYDKEEKLWEEKTLMTLLPEYTWPAGKRLTYNLILSGDKTFTKLEINTVVEDWIPHTEEINFTEQVEVRSDEKMEWVEGTYESINIPDGEVVLYTDTEKVAVCKFNIRTPVGATWTASLIPLTASAMDAFSIVEDSKYGDVGTNDWQYVKIKINNPDPIAARNACKLLITVQTSDGRTIVVNNLMPEGTKDNIEEFTIIQNLING